LPHSEEAEKAIIGSILLKPKYQRKCVKAGLKPEMFYLPAFRIAYEGLLELANNGHPVDIVSLTDLLKKQGKASQIANIDLHNVIDETPTSENVEFYTDIVIRKDKRRQVITLAKEAETKARTSDENEESLLSKIKYDFHKIGFVKKASQTIPEIAKNLIGKYNEARQTGKYGISSRWFDVNKRLICYVPEKISIVAGKPGMGKTTFGLNELLHKSIIGESVLILSIEMSKEEVVERLICDLMSLDSKRFKQGDATQTEIKQFYQGSEIIHRLPIYIEHGNWTIEEICAITRDYVEDHGITLAMLDYIQIVSGTPGIKFQNRNAEITHMSQSLVHLGIETKVHMQVISQLSRIWSADRKKKPEPELHHLRDSGTLEQDAFQVLFIYPDPDAETEYFVNSLPCVCKIAKNRHGPTGKVDITFEKDKSRFVGSDNRALTIPTFEDEEKEEVPF